jgi:two-component system OmpR family sensor kinase
LRRVPIRLRVAGAFAVAMAIVLAATSWFLYVRLDSHLSLSLDRSLRLRSQDLTELVGDPGAPLARANGAPFVEEGEAFAQLLDEQGHVLDATRPLRKRALLSASELRAALGGAIMADRDSVPGLDEPARLLARPVVDRGRRHVLVVGASRGDVAEALSGLRDELLIAGPIALALASVAGYMLAGLSLRPVESMRRRAEAISAETAGERLPVPQTGDEIERLAETLNEMLVRIEVALQRERDFVADAGHELRTPLALLRTELELALRHARSREELREAVRLSSEEVDRLAQLAEDLLLIARSDRGKLDLQLETFDASELLNSVTRRFEWRAQETGRLVRIVAGSAFQVRGDRLRLEQALANLVENALRHGGGDVRLSASPVNRVVELHVTDEGRGFPPQFLDRAFERFARADDARGGGSSGLGLSIVRVIAEAHGGTAHIANNDGGGADAWIALPSVSGGRHEEAAA